MIIYNPRAEVEMDSCRVWLYLYDVLACDTIMTIKRQQGGTNESVPSQ